MANECVLPDSVINIVQSDGNKFVFNNGGIYDASTKYALTTGTYKILNANSSHPIAILNDGNSNISYTGDSSTSFSKTVSGTTADGTYTFYYGTITITVTGDFGTLSYYCYNHGYMGGENNLVYDASCSAIAFPPSPESPAFTEVGTLRSYGQTKYTDSIFESRFSTPASGTFTFSDKPNEGSTITLTDYESTSKVFEIDNEIDGVSGSNIAVNGIAAAGGGLAGTATDLVAKINSSSLKMTATNPSAGMVVLTQDSVGYAGNTSISVNDSSHWNSSTSVNVPSAFAGGASTPEPNIKTVRVASHPQGVGDFTTIQAWEDYADGQSHPFQWAECYDGGNLGTFTVDGWSSTPLASGYPRIFGAKSEYHDGNLNDGAFIQAAAGSINTISVPYTRVERLRSTAGIHIDLSSASNVLVRNCAVISDRGINFKAKAEVSSVSSSGNLFHNCMSLGNINPSGIVNTGFEIGGENMINGLPEVKCINCTSYGHNNVGFRSYNGKLTGFNGGAHTAFVNCISASNSGSDFAFSDNGDGSGIFAPNLLTDNSNTNTYYYNRDDITYINVPNYSETNIFKNPSTTVNSINGVQGDFRLSGSYQSVFGYSDYTIPLTQSIASTGENIFRYSDNPRDSTNEGGFNYSINGVQRGSFALAESLGGLGDIYEEASVWDFGAYEYSTQIPQRRATLYIFGSGDFPSVSGVANLFSRGAVVSQSGLDLYTKSNNPSNESLDLFIKQERFTRNATLYTKGSALEEATPEDVDQYTDTSLGDSIINLSTTAGGAGAGGGVGTTTPANIRAPLFITTSFPAEGLSPVRRKNANLFVVGVSDMFPKAFALGASSYNRSLTFDSKGYIPLGESRFLFSKTESDCDISSAHYKFNESANDSNTDVTITLAGLGSGTVTKNNSYGNEITTVGNFNGVYTRRQPDTFNFDDFPDDALPYVYNNDENVFFSNNFLLTGWTLYKRQDNSSPFGDVDTQTYSILISHSGFNQTNNVNYTYASGYVSPAQIDVWSSGVQASFSSVQDHDIIKAGQPTITGGPTNQFNSSTPVNFDLQGRPFAYIDRIVVNEYDEKSNTVSTNHIEVGLIRDSAIFLSKSINGIVQDSNNSSGKENSLQHPHNSVFSSNGGIAVAFWINRLGYQVKSEGFTSSSTELPLAAEPPRGDEVLSFPETAVEVYKEAKDFDELPEGIITKGEMHFNSNGNYNFFSGDWGIFKSVSRDERRKDLEFFVNVLDRDRSSSVINEGINIPSKKWFYVMYVIDTERRQSYVIIRDQKDVDRVNTEIVDLQNWKTATLSSRENETQTVDGSTSATAAATQTTSHKFRIGYNTFNDKDLGITHGDVWGLEELKIFNNVCSKNAMVQLFDSEFNNYLGFYYQRDSVDLYMNGIL